MTETAAPEVTAHRNARRVAILGGEKTAIIRPWTMKQRAELKPLLAAVFQRIQNSGMELAQITVAGLILEAEEELVDLARATVELPENVSFDDLHWEDLPSLIQAIWETSIVTNSGGGVAGKTIGLLGNVMRTISIANRVATAEVTGSPNNVPSPDPSQSSSPHKTEPAPN